MGLRSLDVNEVAFGGRVASDPNTGNGVASLRIASNRSFKDKAGNWQDQATFISVTAFGYSAEALASAKKGDRIYVRGRLDVESWQDKQGQKRTTVRILANFVRLLDAETGGGDGETKGAPADTKKSAPAPGTISLDELGEDDIPF